MSKPTNDASRKYLPARSMDVTADVSAIQQLVHASMKRNHYSRDESSTDMLFRYHHGNLVTEFFDAAGFGLITLMSGRPQGFGEIVVWLEPIQEGLRLSISLTTGMAQAKFVGFMFDELATAFSSAGQLLGVSEPYSGMDLPLDSPGRPLLHGGRRIRK